MALQIESAICLQILPDKHVPDSTPLYILAPQTMKVIEKYWEEVARLIAERSGGEHPKGWSKYKIDAFLLDFHKRLEAICRDDPHKATLCGIAAVKGGEVQSPGFSYYSFRRIFITKESAGNRTTREMFAIYLGFHSMDDFLVRNDIVADPTPLRAGVHSADFVARPGNKQRQWLWVLLGALVLIGAVFMYKKYLQDPSSESACFFVRNEKGIALVDLNTATTTPIIEYPDVIGFDFDPATRMLFWANANGNYRCISCVRLDSTLKKEEPGTLDARLTERMGYPAGLVLDPAKKIIYCANYADSNIVAFDYQGRQLSASLTGKLKGRPSSIELDIERQILYWTDVTNDRIGRVFLENGQVESDFITNAGLHPDGLALDTLNDRIYWSSTKSRQIGWTPTTSPVPTLIPVPGTPSGVEIDAANGIVYYCDWDSDRILHIGMDGQLASAGQNEKPLFSAGGASPGVLHLFKRR